MSEYNRNRENRASNDSSILVDQSGSISFVNPKASHLFGYDDADELMGSTIHKLLPEINLNQLEEGTPLLQKGHNKNGSAFQVGLKIYKFCINGVDFLHLVFDNNQQLSELLHLKFALDESTIVAITDQRGKIKYVNEKFCQVSKYSPKELIGKDHRIINSGFHSKEFMKNLWQTISNGEVWKGEIKNMAKDGTYYWVDTTIVPFLDENGKPYEFLAIRQEITDHKRVEEELRNSVQELSDFKFALDASSIVAITDKHGTIKYVNDQFCYVSKFSREELIGQNHRIINSGAHPKEFFKEMWRTIGNGLVWKGEIKNRAKDGTCYWVDTTIVPFLDENQKPYQYVSIRHEITERKAIEEELIRMTSRIIDVQEEERKRLSRNLHDGIGQNLYSHLITINILQSQIQHPILDKMQEEATNLIEEVRKISWELRPSVLDDLGLVPAIRSYLVRISEHYHIDVHFDCSLSRRLEMEKETTIYRIIQEAITNIRKYAEVNEASVTIREMDEVIRVMIEDKGKGFEVTKNARGVGLFSMEERARAVGGSLEVHSAPGKGTKVILEVSLKRTVNR